MDEGTLLTEYARRLPADLFERIRGGVSDAALANLNDSRRFSFRSSAYWCGDNGA